MVCPWFMASVSSTAHPPSIAAAKIAASQYDSEADCIKSSARLTDSKVVGTYSNLRSPWQ